SVYHQAAEAGERWRPADGEPVRPGELLVEGARVRDGHDRPRAIVPWDEGLRYGTAKNGYHGGVTPQEMLAPLILLASASTLPRKGLVACRLQPPAWWDEPAPPATPPADAPPRPPPPGRGGPAPPGAPARTRPRGARRRGGPAPDAVRLRGAGGPAPGAGRPRRGAA